MSRSNISSGIMSRMKVFENDNNNDDPTGEITIITESLTSITTTTTTAAGPSDRSNFAGRVENHEQPCGQTKMMMSSPPPGVQTDADGLILPKKIINPCLESTDRKQLHRELKFNTKVGKSVLNQKSELQRAYEKQKERQQLHNQVQQESSTSPTFGLKGELSRVIMERQQKHAAAAAETRSQDSDDDERQYVNPEYLNARAKLRAGQRSELK